jgi:hypothetical protein
VVEAADDRRPPWARRQPQAVVVTPLELEEQERKECQEEAQVVHERMVFFYQPKSPDISDISCLSVGADKK